MKTQNNTLKFDKQSITELNDLEVFKIKGGGPTTILIDNPTGFVCSNCITHSKTR